MISSLFVSFSPLIDNYIAYKNNINCPYVKLHTKKGNRLRIANAYCQPKKIVVALRLDRAQGLLANYNFGQTFGSALKFVDSLLMNNFVIFNSLFAFYVSHTYVNSRGLCIALQPRGRSVLSPLLLLFSFSTFKEVYIGLDKFQHKLLHRGRNRSWGRKNRPLQGGKRYREERLKRGFTVNSFLKRVYLS